MNGETRKVTVMLETSQQLPGVAGQLHAFHVKGLRDEHHLAIAARIQFGKAEHAGLAIGYSRSQTQRRWGEVADFCLIPLGLPQHDEVLTALWILLHRSCCAAPSFLLLENDSRFATKSG